MYMLNEDVDMKAKVATLARRLEELELKKKHEIQAISDTQVHVMPCTICQSCDHVVDECPTMPALEKPPKFSWKPRPPPYQPQSQTQAPQQTSSVEQAIVNLSKVMGDFVGEQKAINSQLHQKIENVESSQIKRMEGMQNDLSQKIDNIQYSISRLTNLNTVNEKGKFPSQPSQNPKGVHEVETQDVNIPLLDMIKQVPTYAKFLKDLCTVKRGLQVTKNAFLTEQVSAIIQNLGTSVNLLPYSVYKQLGLGGLKPTTMTLSLADSSHLEHDLGIKIFHLYGFPEPSDVLAIMSPWRRREEILPLFNQEDSQGVAVEDPPKLILKPLPMDLKYAYLEEDEKCPVVVSSTLTSDQEDSLLGILRNARKPLDGKF
ncbi:hypothetical protein CK203_004274 [Vitis vinifera]|uniref:Uncharacterized protein n=1 Tax=Vitis vinifera TaxID=29760 RepID=A0A438K9W8_VITVI|nr:hypothetical protein CK203_004274 [Vitis vinifera]